MKKILIFIFAFLSSCSTTNNYLPGFSSIIPDFIEDYFAEDEKPYNDLPNLTESVKVKTIWTKNFSGEIEDKYSFLNLSIHSNNVFIPTTEKKVHIINLETGDLNKTIELNLDIFSGISTDDNLFYFGSKQDTVTAVKYSDMKILWQRVMSSEVMSISNVVNEAIYVRTNDSKITAIDINTGKFLWINSQIPIELSIRGSSKPLAVDEKVYVGFEDGKIICFEAVTGDVLWTIQLESPKKETIIDRLNDIDGKMILSNGVLYAISYQGSIAAIDSYSGQILWTKQASSIFGLAESKYNIFYINDDGIIKCLDKSTGRKVWSQDQFYKRVYGTPIYYNDYIIAQDVENYLHVLDSSDGSIVGRLKIKYPIQSSYIEYGYLYLLDKDFMLKKYEISSIVNE